MSKVKFIPNHVKMKCWACADKPSSIGCSACKGTGMWIEKHYYLIYTDKNGQKMAFGVDSIK